MGGLLERASRKFAPGLERFLKGLSSAVLCLFVQFSCAWRAACDRILSPQAVRCRFALGHQERFPLEEGTISLYSSTRMRCCAVKWPELQFLRACTVWLAAKTYHLCPCCVLHEKK